MVLKRGQRLTSSPGLGTHKLVRLSGPKLALGKALSMNDDVTLAFQSGVYKLLMKKVEMPGMPEFETIGPDHVLAMLVVVR